MADENIKDGAEEPGQTYGEYVADLIERYCQEREMARGKFLRDNLFEEAKADLAKGLDEAFTEMIPRTLDDLT